MIWPDAVETIVLVGFGAELAVRGHASAVAGIVAVLVIRLARVVWPKPAPVRDVTAAELQTLHDEIDGLKTDVSRVALVVGVTAK